MNIDLLNGHEFEALIVELLEKMGFSIGERKLTSDGGIDILAKNHQPMLEGTYIIQCKRKSKKVGQPVIRDLYGVVHSKNANKGLLITNSTFTEEAKKFAEGKQLELVDGEKLRSLLIQFGILQVGNGTAVLPNSAIYLRENFVPSLRKLQKEFDDINNGLVYVERSDIKPCILMDLLKLKIQKLGAYSQFVTNTVNQCFGTISFKEDKCDSVREGASRIVEATQKIIKDYREVFGIIPPENYEGIHKKFLAFYPKTLGFMWQLTNEIEVATKSAQPKVFQINVILNIDEEGRQFNEESAKTIERIEKTKRSNCFIATAAFGTPLAKEINILREFRDLKMEPNAFAKHLISIYYELSPPVAKVIAQSQKIRKLVRIIIKFLIRGIVENRKI